MQISEKMRLKLLQEEFKLRKKQPQSWTAQKYRKYANIGIKKKKEKPEFIEEEHDLEVRLEKETKKAKQKIAGKKSAKKKQKTAKKARLKRKARRKR